MKKMFIGVLAAPILALLSGTPVAAASEQDFVDAIANLDYYAITCEGCAQDALDVGYKVCSAFSNGKAAAVQAVLNSYNADTGSSRNYYATLFAQAAAYELCPQYNGQIGPI